jgi:hypothetical protein
VILAAMEIYQRDYSKKMNARMFNTRATRDGKVSYSFTNATNGFFTWITRGYEYISKNTDGGKIYIVNDSSKVRCKEITTILGVLESIGVLRFKSLGGSNSQIYIYVNETKNMQMVRDKPYSYQNKLLEMVNTRHNDSVEMLTYLFQSDFSSDEIWNHLENYFLGILPSDLVQTKSRENDSSEENAYVSVRLLIGDSLFNDYSCWREANAIFDNAIITTFDEEGIPLADYYASKLNIGDINIDAQLVWQNSKLIITDGEETDDMRQVARDNGWQCIPIEEISAAMVRDIIGV